MSLSPPSSGRPHRPLAEKSLNATLEALGVCVWEFDHADECFTACPGSPASVAAGQPGGPLPLTEWLARVHADDRAAVAEALAEAGRHGDPFAVDYRYLDPKGQWQWLQARGQVAERDSEGRPRRSVGVISDIGTLKRQQEQLEQQQAFTRVLSDSPDRETLVAAMLDTVLGLSDLDCGGFYWRQPDGSYLLVAHRGLSPAFLAKVDRLEPDTERAEIIASGQGLCSCSESSPTCTDLEWVQRPHLREEGLESLIILPIAVAGDIRACLNLASRQVLSQSAETVAFLQSLADQFGQALDRLQAREDAQNQRENLEGFFDALTDYVFVMDLEGRILHMNPAVRTRLGYDEGLIGQSGMAVRPPQYREEAAEIMEDVLAGRRQSCPLPIQDADGREIAADTRFIEGNWNGERALLAISRDVSALDAAQRELERRERYQRAVLDNFPFLVWLKDAESRFLAVNRPFADICGRSSPEELAGLTDLDLWPPELAERYRADDRVVLASGRPKSVEEPLEGPGRSGWIETYKSPVTLDGRVIGTVGYARDITERIEARESLAASEALLRATLDATADGILVVGDDGRVLSSNRRFQELWRIPDAILASGDDAALLAFVLDQVADPEAFLATVQGLYGSDERAFDTLKFKDGRIFERYTVPLRVGGRDARVWSFRDISLREQARAALEKERRFLETLVRSIPDLIWLKDENGVYLACNPPFERLYGASQGEIVGKTDYDFVDRALADFFRANDRAAVAAGGPLRNVEELTFRADGYRGLFETTKTPMYAPDGRFIGVLGIAHDITAAREQEAALRKLDEQRRQLLNLSRDGILIYDSDFRVIEASQCHADMLGYGVDELLGMQPWQWDATLAEADVRACFPDPAHVDATFETRHRRKDGSLYDCEVSLTGAVIDGRAALISTTRDITDRKRAEAAVRESEARFRSLFFNMTQGVFYQAAGGELLDINPAACALLGLTREQFLDRTCESPAWEVLDEHGIPMAPDQHYSAVALRTGKPVLEQVLAVRHGVTGEPVWMLVNAIPEFERGRSEPFRVFVTLQDITASQEAARALAESEERLSVLLRQAADGIVLIDVETLRFAEFNDAACAGLGYTREEFASLDLSRINRDMDPDTIRRKIQGIITAGEMDFETTHRHKDGSIRDVRVTNRPMQAGGRTYVVAIWTDITGQKRQRASLDEALAFLRESQAIARVGGWKANPATDRLLWTEEVYRMVEHPLDCPPAGLAEGLRYYAPESLPEIRAALARTQETGEPFSLECRMITRSGREFWAELRCIGRVEDPEEGTYITGTFQDVSERRAAALALAEAEARWKFALEGSGLGVFDWNMESGQVYFSRLWKSMLGYRDDELEDVYSTWTGLLHPDDLGPTMATLDAYIRGETREYKVEFRMRHKDGHWRWVQARGLVVARREGGTPLRMIGVHLDIQPQKEAEARLLASEARLRQTLENSPDVAVQWYDAAGRVIYWNPASEAIYGWTSAEALGRTLGELIFTPEHERDFRQTLDRLTATGQRAESRDYPCRNKVGEPRIVTATVFPIPGQGPEDRIFVCMDVDITERRRAEILLERHRLNLEEEVAARTADLSVAKEAAEAASRAKSTFLANMSHELRTPMNAIMGMTGLALRRAEDPKLKDQLGKIDHASRHLLAVINDILDLTKIEAERLTLEQIDFRLGEVLENDRSLIAHKAAEKGLTLTIDIPRDLAVRTLRGDPLRLGQVLLNLSGNAVKFTASGGITLRVRLAAEEPEALLVRFEVADTGIGIPPEQRGRLFSAFEQADGSMSRKYGGTGLGLAISKRLVHLMGGEIGVDSQPGTGSTFWFTVRLAPSTGALSPPPASPDNSEAHLQRRHATARILLAEDEPLNQEVSMALLEMAGLAADLAADGAEALQMARNTRYDLILMDVQMPQLSGIDATRAIRESSLNRDTPILAMTANAFDEDRQICLEAGMNDHIGKPVDPALLYDVLLIWLDATREPGP
jgi:PAS domain S-box-containing protein